MFAFVKTHPLKASRWITYSGLGGYQTGHLPLTGRDRWQESSCVPYDTSLRVLRHLFEGDGPRGQAQKAGRTPPMGEVREVRLRVALGAVSTKLDVERVRRVVNNVFQ